VERCKLPNRIQIIDIKYVDYLLLYKHASMPWTLCPLQGRLNNQHHFYAAPAPAPGENFDAALAPTAPAPAAAAPAPAPTLLYSKAKFFI
jgi:hypothetical protein